MAAAGCVTDWAATGAMLQGIGTLAGVVAVIWGAKNGANVWKKQKQAERRMEIAERILTAAHKGRSALAGVRGQMVWEHELSGAEKKLKEDSAWEGQTAPRKKRLTTGRVFYDRLNRTRDEQLALSECLPMAQAQFGEKLEKAIEKLSSQFWIVQGDVEFYIDDEGNDPEFTRKIKYSMYSMKPRDGEKNEVSDAIELAVSVIEEICRPALRLEY